jgi:hypothetical protein
MSPSELRQGLRVLQNYYATNGQPHVLNDVQIGVYGKSLLRFTAAQFETAADQWMQQSKWFPALSDLLSLLEPKTEMAVLAHLAWTTIERALRAGGVYRGAYFPQGAVGEAFRQTFGSWQSACQFQIDSPGWAIRRQTFLAIFPAIASRVCEPVMMPGLHDGNPYQVPALAGLPSPLALPERANTIETNPIGRQEAKRLVDDIQARWKDQHAQTMGAAS